MPIRPVAETDAGPLFEARLEDGGFALSILNLGARTRGWWVPLGGRAHPVVLGFDDPARYLTDEAYMGVIAGRVANRITGARFSIAGEAFALVPNEGANQLHGGAGGLHSRLWRIEEDSAARALRLSHVSPDGAEGYPGEVRFEVVVTLAGDTVTYDMRAQADRVTPVNLAQHNYYDLGGGARDHRFHCIADRFAQVDAALLPTGKVAPVAGTALDFRAGRTLAGADPDRAGADIHLVFPETRDPSDPVARFSAPNGLSLEVRSDQPGAQFYTGAHLPCRAGAHPGQAIGPFRGVCFEPQGFPDAVNRPEFPPVMISPDRPYRQRLSLRITGADR